MWDSDIGYKVPLIEEVRFARDSPLEGGGFELPVPRRRRTTHRPRAATADAVVI
jgi:hypothetical protein